MRVLHCIPSMWSGSGGPTRALVEICRATRAADPAVQLTVATTGLGMTEEWLRALRADLPPDVDIRLFPQVGARTWNLSWPMARWCWANLRRYDVLHVHAVLNPISSMSAWIARRRRVPYVLRPLGSMSTYTFSYRRSLVKRLYYGLIDSRTVRGAACLHFTTQQELTKASRLGFRTRTRVIPIPYERTGQVQRSPGGEPAILFLGRLDPVKGLDVLLPAFAQVRREVPDARLVIAGSGTKSYEAQLKQRVSQLGLTGSVEFPGFVEGAQKEALLERAALFVLPSHQENFGLAAVEAMAVGLPVIVTKGVDLWPEVQQADAGLAVEQDVAQLAPAMTRLLRDPEARQRMGRNGAALVRDKFSYQAVGRVLLEMYTEAVEERRARR